LAQFDVIFSGVEISLIEVTAAVDELATDIRAKYNLKTPDARPYASAMEAGAKVFLTGDRVLARCSDVAVEILSNQARRTRRWRRLAIASCGIVQLLAASCSIYSKDQQSKISAYICFVVAILSLFAVGKQLREC